MLSPYLKTFIFFMSCSRRGLNVMDSDSGSNFATMASATKVVVYTITGEHAAEFDVVKIDDDGEVEQLRVDQVSSVSDGGFLAAKSGSQEELRETKACRIEPVCVRTVRKDAAKLFGVPWQHTRLIVDEEDVTSLSALNVISPDPHVVAVVDVEKQMWLQVLLSLEYFFYQRTKDANQKRNKDAQARCHNKHDEVLVENTQHAKEDEDSPSAATAGAVEASISNLKISTGGEASTTSRQGRPGHLVDVKDQMKKATPYMSEIAREAVVNHDECLTFEFWLRHLLLDEQRTPKCIWEDESIMHVATRINPDIIYDIEDRFLWEDRDPGELLWSRGFFESQTAFFQGHAADTLVRLATVLCQNDPRRFYREFVVGEAPGYENMTRALALACDKEVDCVAEDATMDGARSEHDPQEGPDEHQREQASDVESTSSSEEEEEDEEQEGGEGDASVLNDEEHQEQEVVVDDFEDTHTSEQYDYDPFFGTQRVFRSLLKKARPLPAESSTHPQGEEKRIRDQVDARKKARAAIFRMLSTNGGTLQLFLKCCKSTSGTARSCWSLRDDKELILAAVENSGMCLRHASEKLRADPDIVLAACRQNENAIKFSLLKFDSARGAKHQQGQMEAEQQADSSGSDVRRKEHKDTITNYQHQDIKDFGVGGRHEQNRQKIASLNLDVGGRQQEQSQQEIASDLLQHCGEDLLKKRYPAIGMMWDRVDRDTALKAVERNWRVFSMLSADLKLNEELAAAAVSSAMGEEGQRLYDTQIKNCLPHCESFKVMFASAGNLNIRQDLDDGILKLLRLGLKESKDLACKLVRKVKREAEGRVTCFNLAADEKHYEKIRDSVLLKTHGAQKVDASCEQEVTDFLSRALEEVGSDVVLCVPATDLYLLATHKPEEFCKAIRESKHARSVFHKFSKQASTRQWLCSVDNKTNDKNTSHSSDRAFTGARRALVFAAAGQSPQIVLKFGAEDESLDFSDNDEVVDAAVEQYGGKALYYASERLRRDPRFVYRLFREGNRTGYSLFLDDFLGWQSMAPRETQTLAHIALERGYLEGGRRLHMLPALGELQESPVLKELERLYIHHMIEPVMELDNQTTIKDIFAKLDPQEKRVGSYEEFLKLLDEKKLRAPPLPDDDEEMQSPVTETTDMQT
ncbi:unnamed protein product [Amoebophrya sp. A25]|nr:unnamed protein product [Amoebophrya sp. A25]|eukprot:GSA25T00022143001.1